MFRTIRKLLKLICFSHTLFALLAAVIRPTWANEVSADDLRTLVRDNSAFAVALYKQLPGVDSENVCFAPYSISTALAMSYAGARGTTAEQMAAAMHTSLPEERLHAAHRALAAQLRCGPNDDACQLALASRLWGRRDTNFLPGFLRTIQDAYGTEPARLDFALDPEASRQEINRWVAGVTREKIKDLLSRGNVTQQTTLVLTNAGYFKAGWKSPFDKSKTHRGPFHAASGQVLDAALMHQTGQFKYAETDEAQILDLPYEGENFSLIVVLPKRAEALPGIEERLSSNVFGQWLRQLAERRLDVFLPDVSLASRLDLKPCLKSLGMDQAFGPHADFSGMAPGPGVSLSAAVHQSFIDVNEEGTEAAAATAVAVKDSEPTVFRADHPFVFFLIHDRTGSILFMGRVNRPK